MMLRLWLLLTGLLCYVCIFAQAKDSIKVLFIYGSKPAGAYRGIEPRWFGGKRGGHAAIQIGADKVLSFRSTKYPCHIFSKRKKENLRSVFEYRTVHGAWETFPPHNYLIDSLQRAEVVISIDALQRAKLDSLAIAYTSHTPYDYAFFGIRCASATYDVLQQLGGIVSEHRHGNWLRIFTVRSLRKRLFKEAKQNEGNGWEMRIYKGGKSRIWEKDF
jgi:hypothetical protein